MRIPRTMFERKCYTIHITRWRTINCIYPLLVNVFIYHFPIFFPLSSILLSVLERNLVVGKIVNFKSKLSDEREGVWTSCIEMAVLKKKRAFPSKREVRRESPSNHKREFWPQSGCTRKHVLCRFRRAKPRPRAFVLRIQWPAPFCLDHFCRSNLNCWLAAV